MNWRELLELYTRPVPQPPLRAEYLLREELLKAAREVEEIAAMLQSIADDLREAIK